MALSPASVAIVTAAVEPAGEVAALTRRLVAAEDAAWTEAHERYAPRLFRYLLVATHGDEEAAREALQGAFIRAVRHARLFETEEALWGWLTLLARHTLADARRSTTRWRRFLERFTSAAPTSVPMMGEADPLPALLETALAALSESDRLLLEQKYITVASIREIAEASGTTEKAIESRLTRARGRLRETILLHLRS